MSLDDKTPSVTSSTKQGALTHNRSISTGIAVRKVNFRENLRTHEIRIEDLLHELSGDQISVVFKTLSKALIDYLKVDRSIYLERFGVLFPQYSERTKAQHRSGKVQAYKAIERGATFEKCVELTQELRRRYGRVVEVKELANSMVPRLRRAGFNWSDLQTLRYLRGVIKLIAEQVAARGYSDTFPGLGKFLALHNRQGQTVDDWFDGADIFLASDYHDELQVEELRTFNRPVLKSASEPLQAIYGAPLHTFRVNLPRELGALGLDSNAALKELPDTAQSFSISVFEVLSERGSDSRRLIYVSDRLRLFTPQRHADTLDQPTPSLPTELVVELEVREKDFQLHRTPPRTPLRTFVLGWILLQSSPNRALRNLSGLTLGQPLDGENSKLTAILVAPWDRISQPQSSFDADFRYRSLVGVTTDEYISAERHSALTILELLRRKGLHQVTKYSRSSIVARSSFALCFDQPAALEQFRVLAGTL